MSSFGIDIGGSQIKICVWNNNRTASTGVGSEVVPNNRDERTSPNCLSFKGTSFNICSQRAENVVINLSNYIRYYKSIVGSNMLFSKTVCEKAIVEESDRAFYAIQYNSKAIQLDVEIVSSLILQYCYYLCLRSESSIYDVFPMELPSLLSKPHFMTIAIPSYYTKSHIRGLEAALSLRNLGEVAFIRENIAIALDYGYYISLQGGFPTEGKTVLFCDMGCIACTVTVVHYTNNGFEILGSRYEMIGGMNLDDILAEVLYTKCCEQFNESIERTDRIDYKLKEAAEKAKKELSAAGMNDTNYSISNMIDDEDGEGDISYEEFEEACKKKNIFEKFYHFIIESIQAICGDRVIDVIEIVGSTMRIPQFRKELLNAVKHCGHPIDKISNTMNMEEACARGCALFSNLYWEEKSVCCSKDQVVLKVNDKVYGCMNICGCSTCEMKKDHFIIQNHDTLEEGEDHDWNRILNEGKHFMEDFIKNCDDLNKRQQRRDLLEQYCSELRSYISNCHDEKPELESTVQEDTIFADSIDVLIRSKAIQTINVYDDKINEMNNRLAFYRQQLSVDPNRLRIGDVEYVGIWINNKMTGSFECYDLKGIHLYTANFREGILHGKMIHYYESKVIKSIQYYADGQLNGPFIGYYENGQIADKCTYKDNKKEGYWQVYYKNGQIAKEGEIKDGKNVFINIYHQNGVIAYQHLFSSKGTLQLSYQFNRDGDLVYQGKMVNGYYDGKGIVFYRNQYYAKCLFNEGIICKDGSFYSKDLLKWSTLDKQIEEKGTLDTSIINWKKIKRYEDELVQCHEVSLHYLKESHIISLMNYQTNFDILKNEGNGEVAQTDENGNIRYLSDKEMLKRSLYDSDIQVVTTRVYTLFGDLKKIVDFKATPFRCEKYTYYYPCGRKEVELNNPSLCRKRSEGEKKNKKECGHWKEYYNNGKLRFEGEKENGEWIEKKCYLNSGKLMKE